MDAGELIDLVTEANQKVTAGDLGKGGYVVELVGGPYDGAVLPMHLPKDYDRGIEMFLPLSLVDPESGEADYAWYRLTVPLCGEAVFWKESRSIDPAAD